MLEVDHGDTGGGGRGSGGEEGDDDHDGEEARKVLMAEVGDVGVEDDAVDLSSLEFYIAQDVGMFVISSSGLVGFGGGRGMPCVCLENVCSCSVPFNSS